LNAVLFMKFYWFSRTVNILFYSMCTHIHAHAHLKKIERKKNSISKKNIYNFYFYFHSFTFKISYGADILKKLSDIQQIEIYENNILSSAWIIICINPLYSYKFNANKISIITNRPENAISEFDTYIHIYIYFFLHYDRTVK